MSEDENIEQKLTREANKSMNVYQRIHAVMSELDYIQKDKKQGLQFSYANHDKVTAKVREACIKQGLVLVPRIEFLGQDGNRTELIVHVRIVNIDAPEDFVEASGLGFGIDNQDKGPGKAYSYGYKYALLKAFALETGDDPDQDQGRDFDHRPAGKALAGPQNGGASKVVSTGTAKASVGSWTKVKALMDKAKTLDPTRGQEWLVNDMKAKGHATPEAQMAYLEAYIKAVEAVRA